MRLLLAVVALGLGPAAWADCDDPDTGLWDTASLGDDCDGDGWTIGEGDCDDAVAEVNPSGVEVCDDFYDNDCNGFFNDGCDGSAQRGGLSGGSTCSIAGGGLVWFLFVPVALCVRRRR